MDPRLVVRKEVSDNREVDATGIEECVSFLLVAIKVCWHCWLDLCQRTGHPFILLSPTISETISDSECTYGEYDYQSPRRDFSAVRATLTSSGD